MTLTRTKHRWKVAVQREDGNVQNREVAAHWDPAWDGIKQTVGEAAVAEAYMESGPTHERRKRFVAVGVELIA